MRIRVRDTGKGIPLAAQEHIFESFFSTRADKNTLFLLTKPNYPGKTDGGLKIGATREAIVGKYGNPLRSIATPNGEILAYSNILFILKTKDGNPKEAFLERWVLFKE